MSKRKWHSGPPPHVGWWNASLFKYKTIWCWWDGKDWSCPISHLNTSDAASKSAAIAFSCDELEWTDYYPKNARVPRVDPRIES